MSRKILNYSGFRYALTKRPKLLTTDCSIKVKESLGNIVIKNIKGMPLLRPRLLKSLIFTIKTI